MALMVLFEKAIEGVLMHAGTPHKLTCVSVEQSAPQKRYVSIEDMNGGVEEFVPSGMVPGTLELHFRTSKIGSHEDPDLALANRPDPTDVQAVNHLAAAQTVINEHKKRIHELEKLLKTYENEDDALRRRIRLKLMEANPNAASLLQDFAEWADEKPASVTPSALVAEYLTAFGP